MAATYWYKKEADDNPIHSTNFACLINMAKRQGGSGWSGAARVGGGACTTFQSVGKVFWGRGRSGTGTGTAQRVEFESLVHEEIARLAPHDISTIVIQVCLK